MRILLIQEDLVYLSDHIAEIEKEFIVDVAYTASDGSYMSEINDYDVIVVDGSLPNGSAIYCCKDIRTSNVSSPILYLSDSRSSIERTSWLHDGANACLSRKSSTQELSAQIKALARLRYKSSGANSVKLLEGTEIIDLITQQVTVNNKEISMRRKEFNILEHLLLNRGRAVSKEELLDHVWDDGILVKSNSLEVHIRNLRFKLERPTGKKIIRTMRGYGYRID